MYDGFDLLEKNLGKYHADFVRAVASVISAGVEPWSTPILQVADLLSNEYTSTCIAVGTKLGISAQNAGLLGVSAKGRFLERESKKLSNIFNFRLKSSLALYLRCEEIANEMIAKGRMNADVKAFMVAVRENERSMAAFLAAGRSR